MRVSLIATLMLLGATACAPLGPTVEVTQGASAAHSTRDAGSTLNTIRRAQGLPALRENQRLNAAARTHAADMARNNLTGHRGSDGTTPKQRIAAAGYRPCGTAENVAWGSWSAASVMQAWSTSPGHRENMMNPIVKEFGYANVGDRMVLVFAKSC